MTTDQPNNPCIFQAAEHIEEATRQLHEAIRHIYGFLGKPAGKHEHRDDFSYIRNMQTLLIAHTTRLTEIASRSADAASAIRNNIRTLDL